MNSEGASPGLHAALHAGWERRIERARHLAATSSSAADVLTFYAALAEYQQSLLRLVPDSPPHVATRIQYEEPSLADAIDVDVVLSALPDFLLWLQRTAPAPLANAAAQMRHSDAEYRRSLVHAYLFDRRHDAGDADEATAFVVEALLQPFAEWSATLLRKSAAGGSSADKGRAAGTGSREATASRCPMCGDLPVVGALREAGHGAKRTLVCGLCLTERDYLRVVCPRCGEQRFDALPIYTVEQFAHVRIGACDSCRTYLKTIDLTTDGTAVPLVDDIATLSLDLWARDQGYRRLRANLLRL